jgi:endonuclease III
LAKKHRPPARKKRAAESPEHLRARALTILRRLLKEFPEARTALLHENPFQLLIATILSAQCTDERVNMVTKELFKNYPTPRHLAEALPPLLEQEIRSTGFYRMKTKSIIGCSQALVDHHGGKVPQTMDELVNLPGVGRKTANVVLGQAFGVPSGVVVDTHVQRLSQRLAFSAADDPARIEDDLMSVFPEKYWIDLGSVLILHGRRTCRARKPDCVHCPVSDLCPSAGDFPGTLRKEK